MNEIRRINPEHIAYWFFRLNGCMTIPNFIVHPDRRARSQRTDVDVLAVRFPHRCELITSGNPMADHKVFNPQGKIEIVLAEVKHGICRLNGPWTHPPDENMQRVLYAIGAFPVQQVPIVAHALYHEGVYIDESFLVRLFAIGNDTNSNLQAGVVQLTWGEILQFIYQRFNAYMSQKAHHPQWDITGRTLYNLATRNQDEVCFIKIAMEAMDNWLSFHNKPSMKQD